MTVVDIIALIMIILGALFGFKKGAIKGLVKLIGLVSIVIISYELKDMIGNLLIKHMPFINFGGKVADLYTLNLLVYQAIAFIIIFVVLYSLLNILIDISGIIELILKITVIFEIPSKIIGAVLGAVEAIFFVFIVGVSLLQFSQTSKYVMESKLVKPIVEKTPIVNMIFRTGIGAAENIYEEIDNYQDTKDSKETNLAIIRILIKYDIVKAELIQECIDNGKLHLENVVVAS